MTTVARAQSHVDGDPVLRAACIIWYIGVLPCAWTQLGCFVGALCVVRFCFIIYTKEESRRRKRDGSGDYFDGNGTIEGAYQGDKTPPAVNDDSATVVTAHAHRNADRSSKAWALSNGANGGSANSSKTWALSNGGNSVSTVHAVRTNASKHVGLEVLSGGAGLHGAGVGNGAEPSRQRQRRPGTKSSPLLSKPSDTVEGIMPAHGAGTGIARSVSKDMWSDPLDSGAARRCDSFPEAQPVVSPLNSVVAGFSGSDVALLSRRTPRAVAGLEVTASGSLWDQATTSPLQTPSVLPSVTSKAAKHSEGSKSDTAMFEDTLLRAVEKRWAGSRGSRGSGEMSEMSLAKSTVRQQSAEMASGLGLARSSSFLGTPTSSGKKTAMLAAGKCWTCQCNFENSDGQNSCLGCGRVAPVGRPRSVGLTIRQSSWVPPGGEVGGDSEI